MKTIAEFLTEAKLSYDKFRGAGNMDWMMMYDQGKLKNKERIIQTKTTGSEKDAIKALKSSVKNASNVRVSNKIGIRK